MMKNALVLIFILLGFAAGSCRLLSPSATSVELQFSPDTLPEGHVGKPYAAVITLSNQRTPAFEIGVPEDSLPPGLTGEFDQDKQTYTLSGTPTQPGTYSLKISAICYGTNKSGQSGEKEYQLVIHES